MIVPLWSYSCVHIERYFAISFLISAARALKVKLFIFAAYLFEKGLIQNSVILQRYCPAEVVLDFDTEYSYIKEYLDMINLPVTNYSFSVSIPMTPASKLQDNLTEEKSLQYLSNCLRLYYDCLADGKRFNVYYEDNINNPYDRLYKIIRTNLNQYYKNEYSVYGAVSVYDKEELPILLSLFPSILCFNTSIISFTKSSRTCPSGTSSIYIKILVKGA